MPHRRKSIVAFEEPRMTAASRFLLAAAFWRLPSPLTRRSLPPPAASALLSSLGAAESNAAFTLVGRIPVPQTGTWDHLALDAATDRLFASAQDDNQVRVFDLHARKPLYSMSGGFNRPQVFTTFRATKHWL